LISHADRVYSYLIYIKRLLNDGKRYISGNSKPWNKNSDPAKPKNIIITPVAHYGDFSNVQELRNMNS
jgi:hypothetical protein